MTLEERNELIVKNMALVNYSIKKYIFIGNDEYEDLFQEGCLYLTIAADRYDESISKFATYAIKMIVGGIKIYQRDKSTNLHGLKVARSIIDKRIKYNNNDSNDLSEKDIKNITEINNITSLQNTVNDKSEKEIELIDLIADKNDYYENYISEDTFNNIMKLLKHKLSNRDFDIAEEIIYSYIIGGEKIRQKQLADIYKVSQAQISRVLDTIKKEVNNIIEKNFT